jgi:uncharacterized protein
VHAEPPGDRFAADLRGFGPIGILAILVVLAGNLVLAPLSAVLAIAWAKRSRTPLSAIGLARPAHWGRTTVLGIVLGVALKLAMKSVVMPLLGADPINRAYHYLAGNTAALPGAIFMMIVIAGFGEETLFRGFLFERLGRLLGRGAVAKTAIVIGTSLFFGLAHGPEQGLAGIQQAVLVGLAYAGLYLASGNLVLPMVVHAVFDLTALAIIYADVETAVARWFFR